MPVGRPIVHDLMIVLAIPFIPSHLPGFSFVGTVRVMEGLTAIGTFPIFAIARFTACWYYLGMMHQIMVDPYGIQRRGARDVDVSSVVADFLSVAGQCPAD